MRHIKTDHGRGKGGCCLRSLAGVWVAHAAASVERVFPHRALTLERKGLSLSLSLSLSP